MDPEADHKLDIIAKSTSDWVFEDTVGFGACVNPTSWRADSNSEA